MSSRGWLDRQIQQAPEEVKNWPKWMRVGLEVRKIDQNNQSMEPKTSVSGNLSNKKNKK